MDMAQKNTIEADNVKAAIVAALQQKLGQKTAVWIGTYKDTKLDWRPGEDKRVDYIGLAIRRTNGGEWEHLARRRTMQQLWQFAQSVEL